MKFNINDAPSEVLRETPAVGDVFKKDGGPSGLMVIVAVRGDTAYYLAVDMKGEVTGAGQGGSYYFSRRKRVGSATFPAPLIEWD